MTADDERATVESAYAIARRAHTGQVDKVGVPYIKHVAAVADGLVDFDPEVQIAAMLHDVVEDTDLTLDDLREHGVSPRSMAAIGLVSRNLHPELSYLEGIERICSSPDATLVKISDNAHNSRPDRVSALKRMTGEKPTPRYAAARAMLFAVARREDVERILRRVNPSLLLDY